MKMYKCTKEDLIKALGIVNKKYKDNIEFFDLSPRKGYLNVRLRVIDKYGPGHSIKSFPIENKYGHEYYPCLSSACWHVIGHFFDALFSVNEKAFVYSRGKKITIEQGNWEDCNVGSQINPMYFSDKCDCRGE